jgi:hypothetical protein
MEGVEAKPLQDQSVELMYVRDQSVENTLRYKNSLTVVKPPLGMLQARIKVARSHVLTSLNASTI